MHPIWIRPGTSDVDEVIYSVLRQAYNRYLPRLPVQTILDAGANLGDTAAWYLSKFPESRVLAIEPDPENFRLLQRNTMPYGKRAELVPAALWSQPGQLSLRSSGRASPDAVSVCAAVGQTTCTATSVSELMKKYGLTEIDIFKCDIEGAEKEVFSGTANSWLNCIRCLVIETHGRECLETVLSAVSSKGFSHFMYRNLHFFVRRTQQK